MPTNTNGPYQAVSSVNVPTSCIHSNLSSPNAVMVLRTSQASTRERLRAILALLGLEVSW